MSEPELLESLRRDHINMVRLMEIARGALHDVENAQSTDIELLEDVMRYVTSYPDVHHHPIEDIVFSRLRAVAPELGQQIDSISAEHETIIASGQRLLRLIELIDEDAVVARADVLQAGREYLGALERHMSVEDRELFPQAAARLTDDDWDAIEARVGERADPVFGATVERNFGRLRRRIEAHRA